MTDYETQLRDEFAKIILQHVLQDKDLRARASQVAKDRETTAPKVIAEYAWELADGVMQARKESKQ